MQFTENFLSVFVGLPSCPGLQVGERIRCCYLRCAAGGPVDAELDHAGHAEGARDRVLCTL